MVRNFIEIIRFAQSEAFRLGNDKASVEHLALSLIGEERGVVNQVFRGLGLDVELFRENLETVIKNKYESKSYSSEDTVYRPIAKTMHLSLKYSVIGAADCFSKNEHGTDIKPEHMMLGILFKRHNTVSQLLEPFDIDYNNFKTELLYPVYSQHLATPELSNSENTAF